MRDRAADRRLMRYLHGELPAEQVRELRAELAKSPALQARLAELHRLWQGLQPSAPTPAPFGYVPKLQRVAEERRTTVATSALGWGAAPPWTRAMAAAALVAGVALGVGLGRMPQGAGAEAGPVVAAVPSESPAMAPAAGTSTAPPNVAPESAAPTSGRARVEASDSASQPTGSVTQPNASAESVTAQRRESAAPAALETEPAETILAEETVAIAGSTTLAEEYWQALEGVGGSGGTGGDGGGEGDAGW